MPEFYGAVDAFNALQDFIIERRAALPDDVREKIILNLKERSALVAVANTVELAYAREEELPDEFREWVADAAIMMQDHGYHSMHVDDRGAKISRVMRGKKVAKAERPEPKSTFVVHPPTGGVETE